MSRRKSVPKYCLHKQSGQAVVTLRDGLGGRRDVLLGPHNSPESRVEYARRIAEWEANGRRLPPPQSQAAAGLSVNELLLAYVEHADKYYRSPDGVPTNEVKNLRLILRRLRELYGLTPVADFNSRALVALRERMITQGLARNRINKDIDRVKRVFKWAAAEQLAPLSVFQGLQTVEGLKAGRSGAKETEKVRPVAESVVEATLPSVRPQIATMARLQLLTGMRPGEVVVMRGIDLDTSEAVWLYRPGSDRGEHGAHKNAYRGHDRVIAIGPRAQEVLKPWLRLNLHEYLFQPRESRAEFDVERRAKRKSKIPPSQQKRKRKANPKKVLRQRYTTSTYAHAIENGCAKAHAANCPDCAQRQGESRKDWWARVEKCPGLAAAKWHPNQLRHTKATEIRKVAGLDAARAVLGHRSPNITETYAEIDAGKAADVMKRLG